jgi:predicted GTPase
MEALVIGKPNVGKSLFVINFAVYLGLREIQLQVAQGDDTVVVRKLSLDDARHKLVSHNAHKTLTVQGVNIDIAIGKTARQLAVLDTVGISEGIHEAVDVRRAMAATLAELSKADLIMHMVDASSVDRQRPESPGPVDEEIYQYARLLGPYAVLANKVDKADTADAVRQLRAHYQGIAVIPVSALTRRGFREVKAFVFRHMA